MSKRQDLRTLPVLFSPFCGGQVVRHWLGTILFLICFIPLGLADVFRRPPPGHALIAFVFSFPFCLLLFIYRDIFDFIPPMPDRVFPLRVTARSAF